MQIKVSDIIEVSSLPKSNINTHKIYWDITAQKFYKSNNGTDWILLGPVDFNYINSLGFITIDDIPKTNLDNYATQTWVNSQGFLKISDLSSYVTQEWINGQNFLQVDDLINYVTNEDLTTILQNYTTIDWINEQNYLQVNDLTNYATQDWTNQQGFLKQDSLSSYATQDYVKSIISPKRATVTISTSDWVSFSTATLKAVKNIDGINLGADGTKFEVVPNITDYSNYENAENAMNVYDHIWRWEANENVLTAIYWTEDGSAPSANLTIEVIVS